jgi:hypothetical protein
MFYINNSWNIKWNCLSTSFSIFHNIECQLRMVSSFTEGRHERTDWDYLTIECCKKRIYIQNKHNYLIKNPVFWAIKTQFVPHGNALFLAIEPSHLMLYRISCFRCGDYDECHLLGCESMWFLEETTLWRSASSPSSGWQESASRNNVSSN